MATFEMWPHPFKNKPQGLMEYVRIEVDPNHVIHRPATDKDREQYSSAYRAFKNPAPEPVAVRTEEAIRSEDTTASYTEKERAMALDEKTPIDSPILRAALKPFRKKK